MVKKECRNFKQKLKHWYRLNNSVDFIETYFYKKFEIQGLNNFNFLINYKWQMY